MYLFFCIKICDIKNDLVSLLSEIEDPRRAAGQRHPLPFVLIIVIMSTMSGYYGYRAVGDFMIRKI